MKKIVLIPLILSLILCLSTPALGATSSGTTVSGTTIIINGNTYIYPNGKSGTSANDTIIIKPYTDEQIQEAEEALEPVFKSFYLSDDTAFCDAIATDEFNHICEYNNWTPDFSSLYACSNFSIDMPPFSEEKTVAEVIINPISFSYIIMMKDDQGDYVGLQHIVIQDDAYHVMGYQNFASAYITYDLRTHAVDIYALLKDSGLDLTKTTAQLFACEAGQYYLFSDGMQEFIIPIGLQNEFFPYETREGYPDAAISIQLISGPDFIKTMIQVTQEITASRSSTGNASEPIITETDNTVSEAASEPPVTSPDISVEISSEINNSTAVSIQTQVESDSASAAATETDTSTQNQFTSALTRFLPFILFITIALALALILKMRRK